MPSSLEHFCVDFLWLPTMPSPTDARCDDSKSCQVEVTGGTIDWSVESGRIPYLLTHCPPLQLVPIKWEALPSFFLYIQVSVGQQREGASSQGLPGEFQKALPTETEQEAVPQSLSQTFSCECHLLPSLCLVYSTGDKPSTYCKRLSWRRNELVVVVPRAVLRGVRVT